MPESVTFTITIPKGTLEDLALNMHGLEAIEGLAGEQLSAILQEALAAGLEEYLGEADAIRVQLQR